MSGGAPTIKPNRDAEPVSPSSRWDILLSGGIIAFAALVAYHNCFTVPFILDDVPSVIENPKIRHLWPIGDALSPSKVSLVGGRPLVNLSFTLNYALGAWNVWGYHALNLAIHVLAGLTLFGIVRRTLLLPSLRERFSPSAVRLALAVAVLWTVHPLQTEAVTYISQRCESLMGLFYLQTLYCFVRGVDYPAMQRVVHAVHRSLPSRHGDQGSDGDGPIDGAVVRPDICQWELSGRMDTTPRRIWRWPVPGCYWAG